MARPIKEGMDYFPHDCVLDSKVERMQLLYGNDGYAFYFKTLEVIYQEPKFQIDISDAETREEIRQILSKKIFITPEKFDELLSYAMKIGLFDKERYQQEGVITSNGVKKRTSVVLEKREKMRYLYQQKKKKVSAAETTPETPQSKVKKSKVKKSNNKPPIVPLQETPEKISYADFVTMTNDEYQKLLVTYGEKMTARMIEILDNYKGSNGKKYKSDYRTILNWVVEKAKKEGYKPQKNYRDDWGID